MVYDGWHATPKDHGSHRGLGLLTAIAAGLRVEHTDACAS